MSAGKGLVRHSKGLLWVVSGLWLLMGRAPAQDFQSWNEVDLTASWRKASFLVPLLSRTDTRSPNPQLVAGGATVDVLLPWRLTLTGGYLFADLPQRSLWVHLPLGALAKSWQAGRFTIVDRNRFEKLIGFPNSPIRYRNRLLLDRPLGSRDRWHLFADDEAFFDLSAGKWNQNRFQAGGGVRLSRRLFLDVYFLQKNPNGGQVTRVVGNILRVELARK